jgi:hypothetical protein
MNFLLRIFAALLSPFLVGIYSAFLVYFFRDPARPFGFIQEYLFGVIFSSVFNVFVLIWMSIGIDHLSKNLGLANRSGYFFKVVL